MKKTLIIVILLVLVFVGFRLFSSKYSKEETPMSKIPQLAYQEGLPEQVELKRQSIYRAAYEKNYENLANEAESNFSYSFGGSEENGFIDYLKNKENSEELLGTITTLLELPYVKHSNIYTWPSVFTKEPKDWTEEDIAQMKIFLTDEEIETYREFGGYAYYRLGITEEGKWIYFIAGD